MRRPAPDALHWSAAYRAGAAAAQSSAWRARLHLPAWPWARLLSIPLFLAAWQAVVAAELVNPILFPAPLTVARALAQYAASGELWQDLFWSLRRVLAGFFCGAAAGIAIGLLTGSSRLMADLLTPIFQMLRPIPPIAFVPVVIVWFGLSEWGKVFLVFWGVFFTVWLSAHFGVQRMNETLLRAGQCLGAGPLTLLLQIRLPASLPAIFVGLRSAVAISFYTLVAAELAGANAGIAYRLDVVQQNMQIDRMMAGLVMLGAVSLVADYLFGLMQRRLVRWSGS